MLNNDDSIIRFERVNKWYGRDFHALRDIELEIGRGERVVVCGPSGSGKSTLIKLINGLEDFQEGDILYKGQSIRSGAIRLPDLRRRIGMVFQQFNLFPHLSVLDNLTLGPRHVAGLSRREAEAQALAQLERVHIAEQAHKFPLQLSGGQQQRVAIARALCLAPQILLFDEPTSALDPEMVKEVLDTMIGLAEDGMTMLCVTHEMGFARSVADRVIFMADGRILEQAPPARFFATPEHPQLRAFLGQILTSHAGQ